VSGEVNFFDDENLFSFNEDKGWWPLVLLLRWFNDLMLHDEGGFWKEKKSEIEDLRWFFDDGNLYC
jgi:hypothetical protein